MSLQTYFGRPKITRTIFPVADDNVLTYLNDDGLSVEPIYYAPIIPMILVNGSKGIGTGFSTDIMCYNPLQIIEYLKNKLLNIEDEIEFLPYYEGFKGEITKLSDSKFLIRGKYEKLGNDKIRITELPVGYWNQDLKELLEELIEPKQDKDGKKTPAIVKEYDNMSKDTNVDFIITFAKGKLEELEQSKGDHGCNGLEKVLKLYTTNTTTNMHLFDANDTLQKYIERCTARRIRATARASPHRISLLQSLLDPAFRAATTASRPSPHTPVPNHTASLPADSVPTADN